MYDVDNKNEKFLNLYFNLEEYYCLENYGILQMAQTTYAINSNTQQIRVTFEVDKRSKEIIIEKKSMDKIYAHIRIYDLYKENYINLYINRQENKYDENDILNRINEKHFFKGVIYFKFEIKEFPLKNYYLEELKNDGVAENTYILKKKDNKQIINNQNEFHINKIKKEQCMNNDEKSNINPNNNCIVSKKNNNMNQMNLMNIKINKINYNINKEKYFEDNEEINLFSCSNEFYNYFPLIGLNNIGLTSNINSILQCLLHIPELNHFFINIYPKQIEQFQKLNGDVDICGRLSYEFSKLVKIIYDAANNKFLKNNYYNKNLISPKEFYQVLSILNPDFSKFELNDTTHLLLYLIQSMHAELQLNKKESNNSFMEMNNKLNLSIFSYLFYGILILNIKCLGCNNIIYNYQYFQNLSFPMFNYHNKICNIYQSFKEYTKAETINGDNQFYCQKCRVLRAAKVKSKIFYAPRYLIINIDYGKNFRYKPNKVEFGEIIDLRGFTDKNNEEKSYELIAISNYISSSGNSGHYIAYCKNKNNNRWYKFNDSMINECNFNELISNNPKLLIYKRI